MAFHLRAQHQLGLQLGNAFFDFEVVVGDQRFNAVKLGGIAHFAGQFAAVGAQPHHREAQLLRGHPGGGHHMRGVAKHKDALAGQVGRVHRLGVPVGA